MNNKIIAILFLIVGINKIVFAQNGCTDYRAINYNASAIINDGSCVYGYTPINLTPKFVLDSLISETSGLEFCNGDLWTHNDSDNPNKIFSIDTNTGLVKQSVTIANATNKDWEDITSDSAYFYIADIGNNLGNRTNLCFYNITKNISNADTIATAAKHTFTYSDQTNYTASSATNFDAEAIIHCNDSLYIFSKNWGDSKTRLYILNKTDSNQTALLKDSFDCNGLITGAAVSANKKTIALLGYKTDGTSFVWLLWDFVGNNFFGGNKRQINFGISGSQAEGIAFIDNFNLLISAEKYSFVPALLFACNIEKFVGTPTLATKNFMVNKLFYVDDGNLIFLASQNNPCIHIYNIDGKKVYNENAKANWNKIKLPTLPAGIYLIKNNWNKDVIKYMIN
jgi:Secretion system C-terminal sorting domain